jgi:hypothetical protein
VMSFLIMLTAGYLAASQRGRVRAARVVGAVWRTMSSRGAHAAR